MNATFKTEWTEPSYGCCYMTQEDNFDFNFTVGTPQQVYEKRQQILSKYSNQKPFDGDGKLYYQSWEQLQEKLPIINKVNEAMQAEKAFRFDMMSKVMNQDLSYKAAILGGFPSLSQPLKDSPLSSMYEDKVSLKRKELEGLKKNNGNIIKNCYMLTPPVIDDLSETLSNEFSDSKNKCEDIITEKTNSSINKASSFMSESFTQLKNNLQNIANSTVAWATAITTASVSLAQHMANAAMIGMNSASNAFAQRQQATQAMISNASQQLNQAVGSLAGSFAGVGFAVMQPTGFSAVLLEGAGATAAGTNNQVVVTFCTASDRPPQYRGLNARCFKPRDARNREHTDAARLQAEGFARNVGGTVWNDTVNRMFVVFYDINNYQVV